MTPLHTDLEELLRLAEEATTSGNLIEDAMSARTQLGFAACRFFRRHGPQLAALVGENESEAGGVCGEAYQLIGCFIGTDIIPNLEKWLDNLSEGKLVHNDLLPVEIDLPASEPPSMRVRISADKSLLEQNEALRAELAARDQIIVDMAERMVHRPHFDKQGEK